MIGQQEAGTGIQGWPLEPGISCGIVASFPLCLSVCPLGVRGLLKAVPSSGEQSRRGSRSPLASKLDLEGAEVPDLLCIQEFRDSWGQGQIPWFPGVLAVMSISAPLKTAASLDCDHTPETL